MVYCARVLLLFLCFMGSCYSTTCGAGTCEEFNSCSYCCAGTASPDAGTTCINGCCPTTCSAGTYAAQNAGFCSTCPAGTYSGSGASSCTSCDAGSYAAISGSGSCTPCFGGSYQPLTGQSSCDSCPAGTAYPDDGATSESQCETCEAGTYSESGAAECTDCLAGTYSTADGSSSCESCPAGTASSVVASNSSTNCITCSAGSSSSTGASSCTTCDEGSYSGAAGSDACFACPSGTYGNSTGMSFCYDCPAGTASASQSATSSAACVQCSTGYYSSAGAASCSACGVGSYATTAGSSSCTLCPAGTASSVSGSVTEDTCVVCDVGTYSSAGASTCASCPTGTFSTAGASSCTTSCPAGEGVLSGSTSSSSSAQVCGACNAGYYNTGSGIYCTICPSGSVSGSGAADCQSSCPAGEGVASGSSSLSSSSYQCGSCQPGYANNGSTVSCVACDTGFISGASASSCSPCGVNTYANVLSAATECMSICPAGSGIYDNGHSTVSSSADACGACEPGYYQKGSSASCFQCTQYQFAKGTGSTSYGECSYPYESFWFDWETGSGKYHPCHAVSIGLSVEVGVLLMILLGLFALSFFILIRDEMGKWDHKNAVVLLVYCLMPIMDYLTDLLYILTSQYYNAIVFTASLLSVVLPAIVFARRLWLRGVRAKFWLWEIPNHVWFAEYDNFYKILVTTVIISPYLLVNSVFLIPMMLLGAFLNGTKIVAIGRVSNVWYRVLTGKNDFDTQAIIDTQVLNEALYTHIACETFLQIIAQVVNNTFMNRWTILGYVSISFAVLNTLNGLYQITYYKLHRKVNLIDIPFSFTMGGMLPEDYRIRVTSDSKVAGTQSTAVTIKNPMNSSINYGDDASPVSAVANPVASNSDSETLLLRGEMKEMNERMCAELQTLKDQVRAMEGLLHGGRTSLTVHQKRPSIAVGFDAEDL